MPEKTKATVSSKHWKLIGKISTSYTHRLLILTTHHLSIVPLLSLFNQILNFFRIFNSNHNHHPSSSSSLMEQEGFVQPPSTPQSLLCSQIAPLEFSGYGELRGCSSAHFSLHGISCHFWQRQRVRPRREITIPKWRKCSISWWCVIISV